MTRTVAIAPVRKSIRVNASQRRSFDVFTAGLDRWWPREAKIGNAPVKEIVLEPRLGGRWYERGKDGVDTDVGRILVWEPPRRFVLSWDVSGSWKPDRSMSSEVEVRFTAEGPNATLVELEHRNFTEASAAMRESVDGGWPGMLDRFRKEAETSSESRAAGDAGL